MVIIYSLYKYTLRQCVISLAGNCCEQLHLVDVGAWMRKAGYCIGSVYHHSPHYTGIREQTHPHAHTLSHYSA